MAASVVVTKQIYNWSKPTTETLEESCKICSKLAIKMPERHQWRCSRIFLVMNIFDTFFYCFIANFGYVFVCWAVIVFRWLSILTFVLITIDVIWSPWRWIWWCKYVLFYMKNVLVKSLKVICVLIVSHQTSRVCGKLNLRLIARY